VVNYCLVVGVYIDLAVGAPLEGDGAVYIFRGGAGAMTSQYSQRIAATDVFRARPLTNFGHTFGHTPGLDVDSNMYPDLVVGAYSTGTVVVLRSRPIVNVAASLNSDPEVINPAGALCHDGQPNICFMLRICLAFSAEPADRQIYTNAVISTPLYAVAPPGESRYNLINPNLGNGGEFRGIGDKSKIEHQRLVDTLMTYHHPKIFPILSRE